jgi:hypothetical protein
MTISLPTSTSSAASWQLSDFLRLRLVSDPAAAGSATLVARQLADNELWLIDHAVVSSDSTTDTKLRLYESLVDPSFYLSGSDSGNFDEADYPGGLQIAPASQLVAVWTGASSGARGRLSVFGRIYRKA